PATSWSTNRCERSTSKRCSQPGSELQHALHQDDVEPATELAADLTFAADLLEAAPLVERDRRVVTADDACHHRVEAVVGGDAEELAQQELADAVAPALPVHVHGVLDGGRVCGPGAKGRQRRE